VSIEEHYDVGRSPRLEVRIQAGRLDVEQGPEGSIRVEVDGRGTDDVEVTSAGDVVSVVQQTSGGRSWSLLGGGTLRVHAIVPEGTDVSLSGASTDCYLGATVGRLTVKTASGDVTADDVGEIEMKSASGDLRVGRVPGSLQVGSASGDVFVREVEGRASVTIASGDLRIERAAGDLRVSTASGDVRIDRYEGSDLAVKSVSGDLRVGIPGGTDLDLDISSFSGEVRLPERAAGDESRSGRHVRFTSKSVSGDVTIDRL
jgi:DUF4097 and DUF4098 domain-containing protein YvlB